MEIKDLDEHSHLEIVPVVSYDNQPVTSETIFILKEVRRNEKRTRSVGRK